MNDKQFPPGPANSRKTLLEMSRDPVVFFLTMMQNYGDFVYVRVGNRDTYIVSDPALLQQIFIEDVETFEKDEHSKTVFEITKQGLLMLTGTKHRQHRRTLQPLFTATQVAQYAKIINSHTQGMLTLWRSGETYDLEYVLEGLTMGIVCEAIFGVQSDSLRKDFAQAMAVFQKHTAQTRYRSHFDDAEQYNEAIATFKRITREMLQKIDPNAQNFLSLMINAKDPETGLSMSDEEICDEALTLLIAGYETTSTALLWSFYLLAKYPEAEENIREEIYRVCGDRGVTAADLPKLTLLNLMFKESLRLYPSVWLMGREVTKSTELGGYIIEAGAFLVLSPYVIHRNPKYFPEPEEFKPERFTGSIPKYAYLPFSLGPHICLGQHFATMEALLILANIIPRFQLSIDTEDVLPEGLFTLKTKSRIQTTVLARQ